MNQWLDNVAFATDPAVADAKKRDFQYAHRPTWPVEHAITPHFIDEFPSAGQKET